MPTQWTTDQVTAMAPDAASVKAGRKLGKANKWKTLGQSEIVLWGEFQGSGSNPYQSCIELAEPAFKCSCPSRKFPCKHALGLAYVFAEETSALKAGDPPSWVNEWLEKRQQRAVKKTAKSTEPKDEATLKRQEKAKKKRVASREEKVLAGIGELQRWLQDLVRQGFAHSEQQDGWSRMAARMVDAQAPGLARWLERCEDLRYQMDQWQEPLLHQISKIHLLLNAYQHKQQLTAEQQADINALIGFSQNKDELLQQDGVKDTWWVLSQSTDLQSQLQMQRSWLWGQKSQRHALIIDFAAMNQVLPIRPGVGMGLDAELVFYPGSWPVRAVIKSDTQNHKANPRHTQNAFTTITSGLTQYSEVLARYPWLEGFPLGLSAVRPLQQDNRCILVDSEKQVFPIAASSQCIWAMLAVSGGSEIDVFGEWNGNFYQPQSIISNGATHNLMNLNLELAG